MERPWSIGTRWNSSATFVTMMLHALRSRFKIRKSRIAILWTSSGLKRSSEKFSRGPRLLQKACSVPSLAVVVLASQSSLGCLSEVTEKRLEPEKVLEQAVSLSVRPVMLLSL